MNLSRRTFIASAALTPVACIAPLSYENGIPVVAPQPTPAIRPPQIGQEWTYIKKDVFNGNIRRGQSCIKTNPLDVDLITACNVGSFVGKDV